MRRYLSLIGLMLALGFTPSGRATTMFEIRGGGDGHGIGMSQYGAYGYALHGETYQFILGHYYQGTTLGSTDANHVVRVLLGTGTPRFSGASAASGQKLDPSLTYSVKSTSTGALVLYSPAGKKIAQFPTTLSITGRGPLALAGHGRYRGALEFRASGRSVQMVNAVGLDDYLRGVIAAEMPASWPAAALQAQAVAARTYAITTDVAGDGYQLYDDTRSQMYRGEGAETPSTDAAVAATSGQIVTYQAKPVTTYFFSSSGGHTENIENVWIGATPEPWLKGVPDPYDSAGGNPNYRWSERLTLTAARKKLGRLVRGRLRGIRVTKRGVSPRVVYAQVVGTGGTTRVTGPQLQSAFGLLSTYMRFTTISGRKIRRGAVPHIATQSWGLRTLGGAVFPARRGARVTIQAKRGKGWRDVKRVRVGRDGRYRADVVDTGTYRIAYAGIIGPTITLG